MNASARVNGEVSYWFSEVPDRPARPALDRDLTVDVVLVGAGYTNLWTAYYLKQARPELDIAIVEREVTGFGASSRNGGWISYGLPGQHGRYAKAHGVPAVRAFQREIFRTIGEIVDVAAREGIDADIAYEGEVAIARNPAQLARLREEYEGGAEWGFGDGDFVMLDRDGANAHARLSNAVGGLWSPHCARVQPAKLASGLAETVERMGVMIYEHTAVTEIQPRTALTDRGHRISAQTIVRGTEGYTNSIKGHARDWLPKLSSMLITAPLTPEQHREIGWDTNVMVRDAGHFFSYIHRTADDRIALGGPGIPYLWGSGWDDRGRTLRSSEQALVRALHKLFPALREHPIDHTWTGILGIPRNWSATVQYDPSTGLAVAGGYVGDGVSNSNLAARTLRDLILGDDSPLVRMPWVGGQIRKWEPEPLRWIALRSMYNVYGLADVLEDRSSKPQTSVLARAANVIAGRR